MVILLDEKPLLGKLTELQKKYFNHARTDKMGLIKGIDYKRSINLPVCPKCERICMYDRRPGDPPPSLIKDEWGNTVKTKPYVTCPHCLYHGPGSGIPFKVHIKEVDPKANAIRVYT